MSDENIEKLITVLLTSAVSGALIGLFMSEKKEPSRREKLAKEGDRYLNDMANMVEEIRHFLDHKSKTAKADFKASKNDINDLGKDAKSKGEDILRRAKKLLSTHT